MDCPTCSKPYPDNATECPHCAVAGNRVQEPEPRNPWESWDEPPEDSWATLFTDSESPDNEERTVSSFRLPSQATLSSSRAEPEANESAGDWSSLLARATEKGKTLGLTPAPLPTTESPIEPTNTVEVSPWDKPNSKESQKRAFGRSADVQEAPLHDSWSTGESSQEKEQGAPASGWAAALKAARETSSDESPLGKEPVQGTEMPQPMPIEDIPENGGEKLGDPPQLPAEPREKLPQQNGTKRVGRVFFSLLALLLVLLGLGSLATKSYHSFTIKSAVSSDSHTPDSDSPPKDDATIWLESAQESLDSKDFELAVPQLESAISFLKKGEGEEGRLKETQVLLATTYSKAGDYAAGAALWTELAKSHPDLRKKGKAAADAALRKNRILANNKVKAAEKAVKSKNFNYAIKIAKEALDIYTVSQGQNSQMARAHGVLGDAYRGEQNTRIAYFHFTEAHKLDPQGRYLSERSKLRLPVRPKPRAKPVQKIPKFVIKSNVPQGNAKH